MLGLLEAWLGPWTCRVGLNPCAAIFKLLADNQSLNSYCLHLSGLFYYGFALSKNVEANNYGHFKPLLAQTVHIVVKGAERAVVFPLEDSRAPYVCSQRAAGPRTAACSQFISFKGQWKSLERVKGNQQFPV